MEEEKIPIETFDALLRDLATWNLVVPVDVEGDEAETWQLVPRAQHRLVELTKARGPWPAERTAYLGRRCADCGQRELTWMRLGTYLCDTCWQHRLASTEDERPTQVPDSGKLPRWVRRHRQQIA